MDKIILKKKNDSNFSYLSNFIKYSKMFYVIMGADPYNYNKESKNIKLNILQNILFLITFTSEIFTLVGAFIYVCIALQSFDTVLEATAVLPCLGFGALTLYKLVTLWFYRNTIRNFMLIMNEVHPKSDIEIIEYKSTQYEKFTLQFEKIYSIFLMVLAWLFNLSSLFESIAEYFLTGIFVKRLAYFTWYPFEINTNLRFVLMYIQQAHAGFVAGGGSLATDLLMISMILLCCMHFEYIGRKLNSFKLHGHYKEILQLHEITKLHETILRMSTVINKIYSIPMLFNFLGSVVIICMVGFQAMAGNESVGLSKYWFFILFELVQIGSLCYLGERLITSSSAIADALYNQNWYDSDMRYRKSLLIVMLRAQKAAHIYAKAFSIISMDTFTTFLTMSYRFLAVLRTMYLGGS